MARDFSFDNAAFHFAKADGPKGFLWKYLSTYAVGILIFAVIGFFALRPVFEAYVQMFAMLAQGQDDPRVIEGMMNEMLLQNIGQIMLGYLFLMIFGAVFWSVIESAVLRRYIREEGFRIGFGKDELRMLVVGLIWFALFLACYLVFGISILLVALPLTAIMEDNPAIIAIIGMLVALVLGLIWLNIAIRLSPAGAMTIRDRKITFFSAWGATKGRFWPMLGAFLVLGVILYLVTMVIYMIGIFGILGSVMSGLDLSAGDLDPEQLMAAVTSPGTLIPLGIVYFVMLVLQGFWQYAWAGIPALAAKTDPRGGGRVGAADAFN